MLDYLGWNNELAKHYFNTNRSGVPVYLFANDELIKQLGSKHGLTSHDLVEAVKVGPTWANSQGVCQKALQTMHEWRHQNLEYPPYIAYLTVFVLAAARKTDFSSIAYYKPLKELLGEPTDKDSPIPSFNRMEELWKDLEKWTCEENGGGLGLFRINWAAVSAWKHVGIPLSQILLTDIEFSTLKAIFAEAGLDPLTVPSDAELKYQVLKYGRGTLRSRTIKVLESSIDLDRTRVLVSLIRRDLRSWDGEITDDSDGAKQVVHASFRITCILQRAAGRAEFGLRCKTASEFPEDLLRFTLPDGRQSYCSESQNGWSTPLLEVGSGAKIGAQTFNWLESFVCEDISERWKSKFRGTTVKILVESSDFMGLVETPRLPPSGEFVLAVHDSSKELVENWGAVECDSIQKLAVSLGLPAGWQLFQLKGARSDSTVRDFLPQLSIDRSLDINIVGGLRQSRGNSFFAFAKPSLEIVGEFENISASSGDQTVTLKLQDKGRYIFDEESPLDCPIEVIVTSDKETARIALSLVSVEYFDQNYRAAWFDSFGNKALPPYDDRPLVSGAECLRTDSVDLVFGLQTQYQERAGILLGRHPGQIVYIPEDSIPENWQPIWFVLISDINEVHYCGQELCDSKPIASLWDEQNKRNIQSWKDVFNKLEELVPPAYPALYSLWQEYQEIAERL